MINLVAPAFVATAVTRGASRDRAYSSVSATDSSAQGGLGDGIGSARVGGIIGGTRRTPGAAGWMQVPEMVKVNLASLWAISHLVLGLCLIGTLWVLSLAAFLLLTIASFTNSVTGATILISTTGFSWAITQWAPFSLVCYLPLYHP